MNTEKSVRQFAAEWNAELEAKGMLLKQDPSSLPTLYEGSILDIPETPESRERIERLKQQIAELEREKQEQQRAATTDVTVEVAREVQSLLPEKPAFEEQPSATDR